MPPSRIPGWNPPGPPKTGGCPGKPHATDCTPPQNTDVFGQPPGVEGQPSITEGQPVRLMQGPLTLGKSHVAVKTLGCGQVAGITLGSWHVILGTDGC